MCAGGVVFRKPALTVVVGRWRTEGECGGMNVCHVDGLESPLGARAAVYFSNRRQPISRGGYNFRK